MTELDRDELLEIVPHMKRIPGRVRSLLEQIAALRRAFAGEDVSLGEYVENLEREIALLEEDARGLAHVSIFIEKLTGQNGAL